MEHMMNCDRVERDEIAERYAGGTLPEAEAEAFEEHYFRCAACLARLEAVRDAATVLRNPIKSRRYSLAGMALAASLLIVFTAALVWRLAPRGTQTAGTQNPVLVAQAPGKPANPWAELGRFEPPPYRELTLRGGENPSGSDFRRGMTAYRQGNYGQALPFLRKAADSNPRDAQSIFFTGIALLLTGDTSTGLEFLRRVDALGFTPYQEEARFHQAKAHLQLGDAAAARSVLVAVSEMRGDWEAQARELLEKLPR